MKESNALRRNFWISFFSMFTSFGTLICCALPALLVSIGLGATMVGLVGTFPQMIWLSENKLIVFIASAVMLSISAFMQYRAKNLPCPIDPAQRDACTKARVWSVRITIFSIVVWLIGAFFAFVAPYIL